jgi:hypothetical protein
LSFHFIILVFDDFSGRSFNWISLVVQIAFSQLENIIIWTIKSVANVCNEEKGTTANVGKNCRSCLSIFPKKKKNESLCICTYNFTL